MRIISAWKLPLKLLISPIKGHGKHLVKTVTIAINPVVEYTVRK